MRNKLNIIIVMLMLVIVPTLVLAANNPGHDTLYIEEIGNSTLTGSLNITNNLTIAGGKTSLPSGLTLYGDGVLPTSGAYVSGTPTTENLYLDGQGNVYIKYITGGDTVYVGVSSTPTNFNVSGNSYFQNNLTINGIGYVAGSQICTASNGICNASGGNGNASASGTSGTLAKFTGTSSLGNSIVSESGSTLTINGNISIPGNFWIGNGGATADGASSVAIGTHAEARGDYGLALGYYASTAGGGPYSQVAIAGTTNGTRSLAILAETKADYAVAIGFGSIASGQQSIAIGSSALAINTYGIAIGTTANASQYAIAIGQATKATALDSIAIGRDTNATGINSVAIGLKTATNANNQLMIGSDTNRLNTVINGVLNVSGVIYENNNSRVCTVANGLCAAAGGNGNVSSVGTTTGYIPRMQSNTIINNSIIYQNGNKIGIGTITPTATFYINGSSTGGVVLNAPAALFVQGGAPQDLSYTAGGIFLIGGPGTTFGTNGGGNGGTLNFTAGDAGVGDDVGSPGGNGGNIYLKAGNGGYGDPDGTPGNIILTAGAGTALYGSGKIEIIGGEGGAGIANGNVYVVGGTGGTSQGNVYLGLRSNGSSYGKIGIATTTPSQLLDVNGSANFSSSSSQVWINGSKVCTAANGLCAAAGGNGNVSSNGATGYLPVFSSPSLISSSRLFQNASTLYSTMNLTIAGSSNNSIVYPLILRNLPINNSQLEAGYGIGISFLGKDDIDNNLEYASIVTNVTDPIHSGGKAAEIIFSTYSAFSSTPTMWLKSSGILGIGNQNPAAIIDAKSSTNLDSGLKIDYTYNEGGAAGTGAYIIRNGTGVNTGLKVETTGGSRNYLFEGITQDNANTTSNPAILLYHRLNSSIQAEQGVGNSIYFIAPSNLPQDILYASIDGIATGVNHSNSLQRGAIVFRVNKGAGTVSSPNLFEAMRIVYPQASTMSPRVGIDDANPTMELHVNGSTNITGNISVGIAGYIAGSQICTAANGLCAAAGGNGNISGGGSANAIVKFTANNLISNSTTLSESGTTLTINGNVSMLNSFFIGNNIVGLGPNAIALGPYADATGTDALAFGYIAVANQSQSIAIGREARSTAAQGVAIGVGTRATGLAGIAIGESSTVDTGQYSLAIGRIANGSGHGAVALGHQAKATNANTIAIGPTTFANASDAIAIGPSSRSAEAQTIAIGKISEASGAQAVALGAYSNSSASNTITVGYYANAPLSYAIAMGLSSFANGTDSVAIGRTTQTTTNGVAVGLNAKAIGAQAVALGYYSHAEGAGGIAISNSANASGQAGIAIGQTAKAINSNAVAIGNGPTASGQDAIAIGINARGIADQAVAMGYYSFASAQASTALGYSTNASNTYATAIGATSKASGANSLAAGVNAQAQGSQSTSIGYYSMALATSSIALGTSANATAIDSIAIGRTAATFAANQVMIGDDAVKMNTIIRGQLNVSGAIYELNGSRVCTVANGLCAAAGGNGNVTSVGSANYLPVFTSGNVITNSIVSQSGGTLTVAGNISTPNQFSIGAAPQVNGTYALAIGAASSASGTYALAIGRTAYTYSNYGIAIGEQAYANTTGGNTGAVAIGRESRALSSDSVALGYNSLANGSNSNAFGTATVASNSFTLAIGTSAKAVALYATAIGWAAEGNGSDSIAIGRSALGAGAASIAMGNIAIAAGTNSQAYGYNAQANGLSGIAMGQSTNSSGTGSIAIGHAASAGLSTGGYSTAIGYGSGATGSYDIAIGNNANSTLTSGVAIGREAQSLNLRGIAIGEYALANSQYGVSIGPYSNAGTGANTYSIALGYYANASNTNAIAIGYRTNATGTNSIAIGQQTATNANNQLMIGSDTNRLNTVINGVLNVSGVIYENNNSRVCTAANGLCAAAGGNGNASLVGTSGYIPQIQNGTTLNNSIIYQNGSKLGIGTSSPTYELSMSKGTFYQEQNATVPVVGSIDLWNTAASQAVKSIFVKDDKIYAGMVQTSGTNFQIFDISNKTGTNFQIRNMTGIFYNSTIDDIYVTDKYAYLAMRTLQGIYVVDISNLTSNPDSIKNVSFLNTTTSVYKFAIQGKYMYTAGVSGGHFRVIDISNPTNLTIVGRINSVLGSSHNYDVKVQGSYAYVVTYLPNQIAVIDISDPTNPRLTSNFSAGSGSSSKIELYGNSLYVSNNTGIIEEYDVTMKTNITLVNSYDFSSTTVYCTSFKVTGREIYCGTNGGIFVIMDISNKSNSRIRSITNPTGNYAVYENMFISGKYVYLADSDSRMTRDIVALDLGGIDSQAASIGNIESSNINVRNNLLVQRNLYTESLNTGTGGALIGGELGVAGNARFVNKVGIGNVYNQSADLQINSSNPLGVLWIQGTTGNTILFVNGSSGNVGIGTRSPTSKLEVNGTITAGPNDAALEGGEIIFKKSNNSYLDATLDLYGDKLRVHSNSIERFSIQTTTGNVGINTTTPASILTVNGNINQTSGCIYLPGGGRLCGNATCSTIYSPNGNTIMQACN